MCYYITVAFPKTTANSILTSLPKGWQQLTKTHCTIIFYMLILSMKLSEWAKTQGIKYQTAYFWFKRGQLLVPAYQSASGTIIVNVSSSSTSGKAAAYVRVSSHDQKSDIERQVARITMWGTENGHSIEHVVTEIGSGLNGHRPKLMRLLSDPRYGTVIVEHKDRLMRFGAEYVEATLTAQGRRLLVVDPSELNSDLVEDMIAVLTSFCARLYGKRSAKNRAKRVLKCIKESEDAKSSRIKTA
jgi:putative resolvase